MFNQILRPVAQNVVRRGSRAYQPPTQYKQATMDDLPVPSGSWKFRHDTKQKKYNATLLFGISFFIGTIIFAKSTGAIYLNMYPPTPKTEQKK